MQADQIFLADPSCEVRHGPMLSGPTGFYLKMTWKLSRKYKLFAFSATKEEVECLYVKA